MIYVQGIILFTLFAIISCRPQEQQQQQQQPVAVNANSNTTPVSIISQTESVDAHGNFNFSYETSNGIKVEENGVIKHVTGLRARGNFPSDDPNAPDEDDVLVQSGSYSYTAPDGTVISLSYIADENGFQPMGDHLPTPPPIPADILRSLPQSNETNTNQQQLQQQPQQFNQFQQPQQFQQNQQPLPQVQDEPVA